MNSNKKNQQAVREPSHIALQRATFTRNKIEVMRILKWDELQYHNLQFESGYDWLQYGQQMDKDWLNAMVRTSGFWKFWINQWNLRDEWCFLPNYALSSNTPEEVYRHIHGYRFIEAHPSKRTFEQAYAIMVGDTFDEIKTPEPCRK